MNICQMCTHNGQKNEDGDFTCDIKCDEYLEFVILPIYKAAPEIYETLRAVKSYLELAGISQGIYHLVCDALSKAEGGTD